MQHVIFLCLSNGQGTLGYENYPAFFSNMLQVFSRTIDELCGFSYYRKPIILFGVTFESVRLEYDDT